MDQKITCPSCGTLTAILTINVPHRVVAAGFPVDSAQPEWIARFVEDRCQLRTDLVTNASDLRAAYEEWARENGVDPFTTKRFGMEVALLPGVYRSRGADARRYRGIGLRD